MDAGAHDILEAIRKLSRRCELLEVRCHALERRCGEMEPSGITRDVAIEGLVLPAQSCELQCGYTDAVSCAREQSAPSSQQLGLASRSAAAEAVLRLPGKREPTVP